jgi:hypothetical protein
VHDFTRTTSKVFRTRKNPRISTKHRPIATGESVQIPIPSQLILLRPFSGGFSSHQRFVTDLKQTIQIYICQRDSCCQWRVCTDHGRDALSCEPSHFCIPTGLSVLVFSMEVGLVYVLDAMLPDQYRIRAVDGHSWDGQRFKLPLTQRPRTYRLRLKVPQTGAPVVDSPVPGILRRCIIS